MTSRDVAALGRRMVAEAMRSRGLSAVEEMDGRRPILRVRGQSRNILLRVSTRRRGDWQTSTAYGDPGARDDPDRLWAFVDLSATPFMIDFAYEAAVQRDIFRDHTAYLRANRGQRVHSPDSTHHRITTARKDAFCDDDLLPPAT